MLILRAITRQVQSSRLVSKRFFHQRTRVLQSPVSSFSIAYTHSYPFNNKSIYQPLRNFCLNSANGANNDDGDDNENDEDDDALAVLPKTEIPGKKSLQPLIVPDVFPNVPIVCVSGNPIYPKFIKLLEVSDRKLIETIRRCLQLNQPYIGVFLLKEKDNDRNNSQPDKASDTVDSLDKVYDVGTFVQIVEAHDLGNSMRMVVTGHRRIKLLGVHEYSENDGKLTKVTKKRKGRGTKRDMIENGIIEETTISLDSGDKRKPILMVSTENVITEPFELDNEIKALTSEIIKTIREIITLNPLYRESIAAIIQSGQRITDQPDYVADLAAALTTASPNELQDILQETNVHKRLSASLNLVKKELEISRIQQKIAKDVDEKVKSSHRKYMLQEQLKTIQKELGITKDDKDAISDKFRKRLETLQVPEAVKEIVDEELDKLAYLDSHSSEFSVTRNYLDWLTCLPWGVTSKERFDLSEAKIILDQDHYGMDEVKKRILEFIAVSKMKGSVSQGKMLCFHGPPGVGKTSIAKSVAKALNREYFRFSVGGMNDVAEIKGHRRTYVGAMPGKVVQCLKKVKTENPLVLIDEIDKIGRGGYQGDPASALLEMLDPEQNANFLDHYLDVPIDLSHVLFICTANQLDTIPEPLRDRMELIEIGGYVAEEKLEIAKNYLIPTALKACGLESTSLTFDDASINSLIKGYCRESGVRSLQKEIEKICRKAAFKIVEKDESSSSRDDGDESSTDVEPTANAFHIDVTPDNLPDFVGKPKFTRDRLYLDTTPPGVVMGLAWTSMGGTVLYIETTVKNTSLKEGASGSLETTGCLGNVMRESSTISWTVARAFVGKFFPEKADFFAKSQVHLHVPEGATPKDGPSAGVTMTSALVSLALDQPIAPNFCMTGELSLTGKVLPVGGIKEKVMAAKRANVFDVVLPAENRKDFDELPSFIKQDVRVYFVETFHELFGLIFPHLALKEEPPQISLAGNT